ncbi:unnamed protein product [Caenorhabditis brenneri]
MCPHVVFDKGLSMKWFKKIWQKKKTEEVNTVLMENNDEMPSLERYPRYDGSESFEMFIWSLNAFLRAYECTFDQSKEILRLGLIREDDQKKYQSIPINIKNGEWDVLVDHLISELFPPASRDAALEEALSLRQGQKDVESFFYECKSVAWKANPGRKFKVEREKLLLQIFINGLKPNIRVHLLRKMPKDSIEALESARMEETLLMIYEMNALADE